MSSEWRSIRPWDGPRLGLSVLEVTSVSASFAISSSLQDSTLESLGLFEDEEGTGKPIADALAKDGLSVNVNGSPWKRVIVRLDEERDEVVVILYGLLPGRQYDIDLGLVQAGQPSQMHHQVITDDSSEMNPDDGDNSSSDHAPTLSTPSSSPRFSPSLPSQPISLTLEERLHQLQHTLSVLNSERDSLSTSLKSARKDAQKSDAALRSEIDILKRASEKNSATEHRARQKVLALQEAVKRAQMTTKEMEDEMREVEGAIPALVEARDATQAEFNRVKEEADRAQKEREKEGEKDRKLVDGMRAELVGLTHKHEKVLAKKEKLETTVLSDLEAQLREIQLEIERVEGDSLVFPRTDPHALEFYDDENDIKDHQAYEDLLNSYLPIRSKTVSGRLHPVHRPLRNIPNAPSTQQTWAPAGTPPRVPLGSRQSPAKASSVPSPNSNSSSSLSSKAPPFEPGKPLKAISPGNQVARVTSSGSDRRWASTSNAQ